MAKMKKANTSRKDAAPKRRRPPLTEAQRETRRQASARYRERMRARKIPFGYEIDSGFAEVMAKWFSTRPHAEEKLRYVRTQILELMGWVAEDDVIAAIDDRIATLVAIKRDTENEDEEG